MGYTQTEYKFELEVWERSEGVVVKWFVLALPVDSRLSSLISECLDRASSHFFELAIRYLEDRIILKY